MFSKNFFLNLAGAVFLLVIFSGGLGIARAQVGNWSSTIALPSAVNDHTSVVWNGYVYTIGGDFGGVITSTVFYAPINSTSSLDAWKTTTPLPSAIEDHTSVVWNGYVYTFGGVNAAGTITSTVFYAQINSTGSLGAWATTTKLPSAINDHTSVANSGYVYTFGGEVTAGVVTSTVFYAQINSTGSLDVWQTTTKLPSAIDDSASVVWNGYVYTFGGEQGGVVTTTVFYAPINSTGSLGAWATTTKLPSAINDHTSVANSGYVYTLGGELAIDVYTSTVFYAPINSTGSLGAWATTTKLPSAIDDNASVVWNGYVYNIGGEVISTNISTSTVNYTVLNSTCSGAGSNISTDTISHWAWNDTVGWIDFCTNTINVSSTALSGYASFTAGDFSLDCATTRNGNICSGTNNYQVTNDGSGNLSNWGWNDTYGWISFDCNNNGSCGNSNYRVYIDSGGNFRNYAWNDTIGWISFNCLDSPGGCGASDYKVVTSWVSTSTSGYVDSTTYDTGVNAGAQLNSVLWRGDQPAGTTVSFQFATSNSSSGPWTFVGTDGTGNTYFTTGPYFSLGLDYSLFNNFRYFRYRAWLYSNSTKTLSPRVDEVIVNWSP